MTSKLLSILVATALVLVSGAAQAATSTFDDLVLPGPNTHYFPGGAVSGAFPFSSGGASFNHDYTNYSSPGCCSTGWSYSNHTDTTTPGFGNQYSAYAGSGQALSSNYGVAYAGIGTLVEATFAVATTVSGAFFTNTTYAALAIRDGYFNATKFGGASGDVPDFFKLTITGFNGTTVTGSVDFFLADYRFADNAQDYIINKWTLVNLSSLGTVTRLGFQLASSDNDPNPLYGMNTPSYFAMDTLTTAPVPEPEQFLLMLAGLGLIGFAARRRIA